MRPSKVFEDSIIGNTEVCNYCFRRRSRSTDVPEEWPDIAVSRHYPSPNSELVHPPNRTDDMGQAIRVFSRPSYAKKFEDRNEDGDIGEVCLSRPTIVCKCGRIDDERINGSFPDDWEDRPKDSLLDISKRVYHRLDEAGFNLDFDDFIGLVEMRKESDEYSYGDYEILEDAVADAVVIRKQDV